MKQPQEWFIEKLKEAQEFYVFVEIAPNTVSSVPISKTAAIQLVQADAEYGYYQDDALFIGATPTDQEYKNKDAPTDEEAAIPDARPKKPNPGAAGEVFEVSVEFDTVVAAMRMHLNDGCKFITSYPAFKELCMVFQRPL